MQVPETVFESVGSFSLNFSLNATASEDIVLTVRTMDISATGYINLIYIHLHRYVIILSTLFTGGLDYNHIEMAAPSVSSLIISSGEIFGSIKMKIIDDTIKEQNETFFITVHIQDNCLPLIINGNNTFTVTIIDNEGMYYYTYIQLAIYIVLFRANGGI